MRKGGLGRGLGSLIPAGEGDTAAKGGQLQEIPTALVEPNPYQPREVFEEDSLVALSESIRALGVLQPILVRPLDSGRYQLIAGERRWRAAKRAGLATVPALVRTTSDQSSLEQAVVENLHRNDLNALEEAAAYQQLCDDFGLSHEDVATRVGKSRSAVTNTLRLLQLPPTIQQLLKENRLSAGHARALLGTPDRSYQEQLARRAIAEGWSVRAMEEAVKARAADQAPAAGPDIETTPQEAPTARLRPPGLLELEELLSEHLDTRVRVEMGAKHGKVIIDFATLEDLERIYHRVTEGSRKG